jgi:conjugative relaxase-like TrwC/TraI family protein
MLSIGKLAAGGEDYYLEAVAAGVEDYYLGAGEAPGVWLAGAEALCLEGEVAPEDLRAVLEGRAPDGEQLAATPPGRPRVPGFDLTFSAPKSVSLLHALGSPSVQSEVVAAHEEAVAAALGYLERHAAFLRRGAGGRERVPARGLVAAAFRHRLSRAQDPALHTHVLVANLARSADGRAGALDGRALYRHASTAGHLYQAELRHRLSRRLGVEWRPVRRGLAEIEGAPVELLRAFSRRRVQIEEALQTHGAQSARAAQVATLATRTRKAPTPKWPALVAEWRARAAELGFGPEELAHSLGRAREARLRPAEVSRLVRELLDPEGLTAQAASFSRREVLRALAERAGPGAGAAELEATADSLLGSRRVVALAERGPDGEPRYTTPDLIRVERELVRLALSRQEAEAAVVDAEVVANAIARRPALSDEQRVMIERLTRGGDGLALVLGRAGAGKTYALDPARAAWEAGGYRVLGAALAARAAAELEAGAGIPSMTVARLLQELGTRRLPLDRRTVVVVDEAGMLGTRDTAALARATARAGAKLVLVGDDAQLPEIAAGGAFRGLAARLEPIRLEGNRRQREPWERQALLDLREGRPERTVAAYVLAGRVTVAETAEEARERLVGDWLDARRRGGDCLMIAARRRDARDLSRRAREALVAAGDVSGPALELPSGDFAVGDQVITLRNRTALGVQNGMRAAVATVDLEAGTLTAVTDDGRRLDLPRSYLEAGHLAHGYAVTAHKAQGLTVERAFVLGGDEVYREWGYTALSRAREGARLYLVGGEPLRELMADDLGGRHAAERREPLEELAADLARSRARELSIDAGA